MYNLKMKCEFINSPVKDEIFANPGIQVAFKLTLADVTIANMKQGGIKIMHWAYCLAAYGPLMLCEQAQRNQLENT